MEQKKNILIGLVFIGLTTISCRQTDEILVENEHYSLSQEKSNDSTSSFKKFIGDEPKQISLDNKKNDCGQDVPRDGSHWLTANNNDDCPKEPPKDGSHWKNGN